MTRERGGRVAGAVAVAAVAVAGLAGCSTDAADQKVIDRLSKLDVLTVPAGATELSRTSLKGGGNIAIRNASGVTLVYATAQTPAKVGEYYHARFDPTWHFKDKGSSFWADGEQVAARARTRTVTWTPSPRWWHAASLLRTRRLPIASRW